MSHKDLKSKFFLLVFTLTAFILGWGVWTNYKPQVIYASCADIAERTSFYQRRVDVLNEDEQTFENNLRNCLKDAGVK